MNLIAKQWYPVMKLACSVALACGIVSVARASSSSADGQISRADAAAYLGRYEQPNIEGAIRIDFQSGYLTALIPGRPPTRLLRSGNDTFRPEQKEGAQVVFAMSGGRATGYTFTQQDDKTIGQRVGDLPKAGELDCRPLSLKAANGVAIDAQRCTLFVPERRGHKGGNLIGLAVVRLISKAEKPASPLIYLHGGPGSQATGQAKSPYALSHWLDLLNISDVILLDQRGCGSSSPRLYWVPDELPIDLLVSEEKARQLVVGECRQAAEVFRDRGVDLAGYTTPESADDLNDLRIALGVDKVSLLGFSYGTHLAQAAIKRHGKHLENVVICGVEGLDMTRKFPLNMDTQFGKLALWAAKDPNVRPYVPDLTALLDRVLAKLERKPLVVDVTVPGSGKTVHVPVGKFGLQLILRLDIGDASDIPVIPRLLYSIDKGDTSVLRWFVRKRLAMFRGVNLLMWVMDGASAPEPYRWARIRAEAKRSRFGDVVNFPYPYLDSVFGDIRVDEDFRSPLVSDVRTLFLSGSLDWNTPPYQAERVRWGFTNGTHIVVENAGHEQILIQPQIQSAVLRFLKGEDVRDVHVALPPPRFVPIEGYDPSVTHPSVRP